MLLMIVSVSSIKIMMDGAKSKPAFPISVPRPPVAICMRSAPARTDWPHAFSSEFSPHLIFASGWMMMQVF
jgi:hypothetical protein